MLPFYGAKMVTQALSAATPAGVLADITSMMNGRDGWTVTADADTFGIYCTPPGGTGFDDDLRILFAGKAAGIGTPTMALVEGATALDTATTGVILCGMVRRNGATLGTFNWDAAGGAVFGAIGSPAYVFTGFMRGFTCATANRITIFYTNEELFVCIDNSSSGTLRYIRIGAFIDPVGGVAGTDCEANGRIYAMACAGGVATTGIATACKAVSTANSSTGNGILVHGTSDGNAHFLHMKPNDTTNSRAITRGWSASVTTPQFYANKSGMRTPDFIWYSDATATNAFLGRDRNLKNVINGRHQATESNPEGVVGYLIGGGVGSDQESLMMEASNSYSQ